MDLVEDDDRSSGIDYVAVEALKLIGTNASSTVTSGSFQNDLICLTNPLC